MRYLKFFSAAVLVTQLTLGAAFAAEPKIEEKIVGPAFTPGMVYVLSPKGMHLATVHGRDGKTLVTVDGVDGPLKDSIFPGTAFGTTVRVSQDGFNLRTEHRWSGPVAFSPDGTRHAYAGMVGNQAVVMLDGREIFRGAAALSGQTIERLHFSPDSKRLFFLARTADAAQSYRLMMDGKPVTPPFEGITLPFFNNDGSRWGLLGTNPATPRRKFLVVDGKDAGYVGEHPQFSPDGKNVICVSGQRPKQSVLVDGKELFSSYLVEKVVVGATGDIAAIATINADGRKKLFVNGKPVVDDATDIVFSPDGKRWAAICALNQKAWVVMNDGTRHKQYWPIENLAFTPDSSKCVYVAVSGELTHVVVEGRERAGQRVIHFRPIYGDTGNGFAYTAGFMMGRLAVHYNDHVEPECLRIANLTLSPDGSRWLYYRKLADNTVSLMVNGVATGPTATQQGGAILFSPDSKHFAAPLHQSYWITNKRIVFPATPMGFTADSQHLIQRGHGTSDGGVMLHTYYVNGDLVAKFGARNVQWQGIGVPQPWEQQPDGTIVFVGYTPGPTGYGPMKRITATPAPGRNLDAWLANPVSNDLTLKTKSATPTSSQPPKSPAAAPAPQVAETPVTRPAAPARPLVWADLVKRPERWPPTTKLKTQFKFSRDVLPAGTAVRIDEVLPKQVRLTAPQGFAFLADPHECDLIEAANAQWARFTPEQRAISGETLAADSTLWPGRVKVTETQKFGNLVLREGTELTLLGVRPNEVTLQHPQAREQLVFNFQYTDLFDRARRIALLPPDQRPGRMAASLENVTVDSTGKPVPLPKAHYYVFYFAASTCPRCEIFTPKIVEHYNRSLAQREDVAFVSWPTESTTPPYLAYAARKKIPWLTIPRERTGILTEIGVVEIPGIIVTDRFGNVLLATNKIRGTPMEAADRALAQLDGVLKPAAMEFLNAKIPDTALQPEPTIAPAPAGNVSTSEPAIQSSAPATVAPPVTPPPPAGPQWLDCDAILKDCMQTSQDAKGVTRTSLNRQAFDQKYRGTRVKFTGTVDAVRKTEGIVVFRGTGKWPHNYHVRASFPTDKLSELDKFTRGRTVTLEADLAEFALPDLDVAAFGMGPSRIITLNRVTVLDE